MSSIYRRFIVQI